MQGLSEVRHLTIQLAWQENLCFQSHHNRPCWILSLSRQELGRSKQIQTEGGVAEFSLSLSLSFFFFMFLFD